MLLGTAFERFAEQAPVSVAVRGLLEVALNARALDDLFRQVADRQYTHDLLFSTCVDLMGRVVSRTHRSLNAAYRSSPQAVGVSIQARYDKVARVEPKTSAELVRHTAARLEPVIRALKGELPALVPGYRVKILDGNHLARTERRLKPLRNVAAGPLPGQALVVYDSALGLVIDVVCGEDGHAQERALMGAILAGVRDGDLWVADRNFCTTGILFGLAADRGSFAIRQHGSTLSWEREGQRHAAGRCETGPVFEQELWLEDGSGGTLKVRRVTLTLDTPTHDGETEIHVLTNLPVAVTPAMVMDLYRNRWTIEGLFQELTTILKCEVNTLGYPKAALFGFCVALATSNVFATARAALRAAHGTKVVEDQVSNYYLVDEITGTFRGLMIAVPADEWTEVGTWDLPTLTGWLMALAKTVKLARFRKTSRGPKKPRARRTRFASKKHISTFKLLNAEKGEKTKVDP